MHKDQNSTECKEEKGITIIQETTRGRFIESESATLGGRVGAGHLHGPARVTLQRRGLNKTSESARIRTGGGTHEAHSKKTLWRQNSKSGDRNPLSIQSPKKKGKKKRRVMRKLCPWKLAYKTQEKDKLPERAGEHPGPGYHDIQTGM